MRYKGVDVGHYCADLLVDSQLILEVKCVSALANDHLAQCINYLKAAGLALGLMVNFQKPKLEWRRVFHE